MAYECPYATSSRKRSGIVGTEGTKKDTTRTKATIAQARTPNDTMTAQSETSSGRYSATLPKAGASQTATVADSLPPRKQQRHHGQER